MAERPSVWGAIVAPDEIHVPILELPDACGGGALVRHADGNAWILLNERPSVPERRVILLHELVHLERKTMRIDPAPPEWDALVAREEERVDAIVADHLVPDGELREFVQRCLSLDRFVTALDVADEFGVPVEIAERACRRAS